MTTDLTTINWKLFNHLAIIRLFIHLRRQTQILALQKWQPSKYTWDLLALHRHTPLQLYWSHNNDEARLNFNEGGSITASTPVVTKYTQRVHISRRTWELILEKNRINVLGKAASGDLLGRMNWPDIIGNTLEPNHLNASFVIELSPDQITWHYTWNAINHNSNLRGTVHE